MVPREAIVLFLSREISGHKISGNLFPDDWAVCWYHDVGVNKYRVVIITHQTLSLEKYWKLFCRDKLLSCLRCPHSNFQSGQILSTALIIFLCCTRQNIFHCVKWAVSWSWNYMIRTRIFRKCKHTARYRDQDTWLVGRVAGSVFVPIRTFSEAWKIRFPDTSLIRSVPRSWYLFILPDLPKIPTYHIRVM